MDNINPSHYKNQCSIECIQAMEVAFGVNAVIDFCLCNSFKYVWRYKNKNGVEDLNKAQWYIDKAEDLINTKDLRQDLHLMRSKEKKQSMQELVFEEMQKAMADKKDILVF